MADTQTTLAKELHEQISKCSGAKWFFLEDIVKKAREQKLDIFNYKVNDLTAMELAISLQKTTGEDFEPIFELLRRYSSFETKKER